MQGGITSALNRLRFNWGLSKRLKARRRARYKRSQAAKRGHSTYWRRAAEKTRELFS